VAIGQQGDKEPFNQCFLADNALAQLVFQITERLL
jgi:hypothetical protein